MANAVLSPAALSDLESERNASRYRSARGRENPVEYPPSGSTVGPVDFHSSRQSGEITTFRRGGDRPPAWHPKLTLYRLMVIFSTIGLGTAKVVTSYLNLTYASITLEWILGVVVFLVLHILGIYEVAHTRRMAWLFDVDYLDYFWNFLHKFARINRPHYTTDEDNSGHIPTSSHLPVTGYHLLVSSTVFIVGMTKSGLLYANRQTGATTVECVLGVFFVTGLYWLGLYEASSTRVYPALFHVDHSAGVLYFATTAHWFCLHLIGISLASALTYAFSRFTYAAYLRDWSTPAFPAFVGLMNKALFMTLPMIICVSGLGCIFMLLGNLYQHSGPFRACIGRYLVQFPGLVIFKRIHEKYLLPTPPFHPKERFFYLKRALIRQVINFPLYLFFLFIISAVLFITSAVLVICAWLITQWIIFFWYIWIFFSLLVSYWVL